MPNHMGLFLAAATTVIGAIPAFAYGSAASHSSSSAVSRAGTAARSIGPTSTRLSPSTRFQSQAPSTRFGSTTTATRFSSTTTAKMLVLTAPDVLGKTTTAPTISTAADPPAPSATTSATSPGTLGGGRGSSINLSQFNTGALDVATPAVSPPRTTDITSVTLSGSFGANLESATPAVSAPLTSASATTTTIGASILNTQSLILPNTTTSGAVPQAPVSAAILPPTAAIVGTTGEVIATSGGSSLIGGGASGRNMPECMAAWDKATHISKTKWREICARTLTVEHMY